MTASRTPSPYTDRLPHELQRGHSAPISYHRILLTDFHRMDAFERAIRTLVRPGDVVLDLGAGTGILAMMAARRGAARVHAVESMAVAGLAEELVAVNGLQEVVTVHRADACTLEPVEPVDLVVSDCLGRFLVDDGMIPAIKKAVEWLKPTGRFCPARVRLELAPVGNLRVGAVDAFRHPYYGLDLTPAVKYAQRYSYRADLSLEHRLAEPRALCEWELTQAPPELAARLSFELKSGGELRALLGWFVAELCEGVVLTNAPGVETHWGQVLFALPNVSAEPNDRLEVEVRLERAERPPIWRWTGTLFRGERTVMQFDLESEQRLGERDWNASLQAPAVTADRAAIDEANREGAEAFGESRWVDAIAAFERAVALLRPEHDDIASDVYENLGLAYAHHGHGNPAIRAFLRALDGRPESREQSLRFLVECLLNEGKRYDGRHFLRIYETAFGAHPSGWTADEI